MMEEERAAKRGSWGRKRKGGTFGASLGRDTKARNKGVRRCQSWLCTMKSQQPFPMGSVTR